MNRGQSAQSHFDGPCTNESQEIPPASKPVGMACPQNTRHVSGSKQASHLTPHQHTCSALCVALTSSLASWSRVASNSRRRPSIDAHSPAFCRSAARSRCTAASATVLLPPPPPPPSRAATARAPAARLLVTLAVGLLTAAPAYPCDGTDADATACTSAPAVEARGVYNGVSTPAPGLANNSPGSNSPAASLPWCDWLPPSCPAAATARSSSSIPDSCCAPDMLLRRRDSPAAAAAPPAASPAATAASSASLTSTHLKPGAAIAGGPPCPPPSKCPCAPQLPPPGAAACSDSSSLRVRASSSSAARRTERSASSLRDAAASAVFSSSRSCAVRACGHKQAASVGRTTRQRRAEQGGDNLRRVRENSACNNAIELRVGVEGESPETLNRLLTAAQCRCVRHSAAHTRALPELLLLQPAAPQAAPVQGQAAPPHVQHAWQLQRLPTWPPRLRPRLQQPAPAGAGNDNARVQECRADSVKAMLKADAAAARHAASRPTTTVTCGSRVCRTHGQVRAMLLAASYSPPPHLQHAQGVLGSRLTSCCCSCIGLCVTQPAGKAALSSRPRLGLHHQQLRQGHHQTALLCWSVVELRS